MRASHGAARNRIAVAVIAGLALDAAAGRAQVAWRWNEPDPADASLGADPFAPPAWFTAPVDIDLGLDPGLDQAAAANPGGGAEKGTATLPDNPQLNDAFTLNLGAMYVTNATTQASKTTNGGVGGVVDFENVLGLKQETWVPFASARWRFLDSFRLEAEYFSINRSATRPIGENIDWGGNPIPAGTSVDSKFDFTDVRVSAGWSFYKTQDKELGVALGLHVEDIRLDVKTPNTSNTESSVVAPLPVISFFGGFAMSDHWSVAVRFDAFKVSWDPYKSHLYDVGLDLVWNPWRNVGIGAGYRSLQLSGSVDAAHYKGELDAAYSGPIVYVTVCF